MHEDPQRSRCEGQRQGPRGKSLPSPRRTITLSCGRRVRGSSPRVTGHRRTGHRRMSLTQREEWGWLWAQISPENLPSPPPPPQMLKTVLASQGTEAAVSLHTETQTRCLPFPPLGRSQPQVILGVVRGGQPILYKRRVKGQTCNRLSCLSKVLGLCRRDLNCPLLTLKWVQFPNAQAGATPCHLPVEAGPLPSSATKQVNSLLSLPRGSKNSRAFKNLEEPSQ